MLLRNRDEEHVFAELSLPESMTEDGQVSDWHTRIILDPIEVDSTLIIGNEPSEPPIEVPVRRRS